MNKITKVTLAAAALSMSVAACSPVASPKVSPEAKQEQAQVAVAVADPYSSDGTWLVPSEIRPGTYRAVQTSKDWPGYVAVCADAECDVDFDGDDTTGLIRNDIVKGSSVVVVPPGAFSVEIQRVTLTPIN